MYFPYASERIVPWIHRVGGNPGPGLWHVSCIDPPCHTLEARYTFRLIVNLCAHFVDRDQEIVSSAQLLYKFCLDVCKYIRWLPVFRHYWVNPFQRYRIPEERDRTLWNRNSDNIPSPDVPAADLVEAPLPDPELSLLWPSVPRWDQKQNRAFHWWRQVQHMPVQMQSQAPLLSRTSQ